jgi:hypothetical protein
VPVKERVETVRKYSTVREPLIAMVIVVAALVAVYLFLQLGAHRRRAQALRLGDADRAGALAPTHLHPVGRTYRDPATADSVEPMRWLTARNAGAAVRALGCAIVARHI